jgi:hypothetical protein
VSAAQTGTRTGHELDYVASLMYSTQPTQPRGALLSLPCPITWLCERTSHTNVANFSDSLFLNYFRYNAVRGWEASLLAGTGERFVRDNFLSHSTLRMLQVQSKLCNSLIFPIDSVAAVHAQAIC